MRHFLKRLRDDRRGATAVEYGLILALIVVVCVGAIRTVGGPGGLWDKLANRVSTAMPAS